MSDEINFLRILLDEALFHYVLSFQGFRLFITFNQTCKKSIWICSLCNNACLDKFYREAPVARKSTFTSTFTTKDTAFSKTLSTHT